MESMSPDEWKAFINEGRKTGKLATIRADGRPHCVPVGCLFEDETLKFITMNTAVKLKNIRRDNRVAIAFDNETSSDGFVTLEGTAEIEELTPEELLPISTRLARRYAPPEKVEEFSKRNAVEGVVLVVVTPTKVMSAKNLSD